MTAALLPDVLQSAVVVVRPGPDDDRGVEVDTLVLDVETDEGPTIVLSRGVGIDGLTLAPHAAIVWTGLTGRVECPVSLRTGRRDYGPVWLARPSGPAVRTQRRAFFRARMHAPVRVDWTDRPEDGDPVDRRLEGVTVDLSEGGALAAVRTPGPACGAPVTVAVVLDGDTLEQPAVVVRHVDFPGGGGSGIAVAFTDPGTHGDRVRRAAFEAERRRLLASRGGGPGGA